ncbi:hypothetical protein P154DRAFT_586682 [Amniculicola lignicola CBS 123094]|uniref:Uncharacterized protein n=1 Tax=Amniculicola lignicola CBS 123094 TaxID=1392246 RepID=A0A6A5W220_9PLEO|nr:hypothetical protein P154DRAFT_586682 [Amniculicola lignicola CBS 123094]
MAKAVRILRSCRKCFGRSCRVRYTQMPSLSSWLERCNASQDAESPCFYSSGNFNAGWSDASRSPKFVSILVRGSRATAVQATGPSQSECAAFTEPGRLPTPRTGLCYAWSLLGVNSLYILFHDSPSVSAGAPERRGLTVNPFIGVYGPHIDPQRR